MPFIAGGRSHTQRAKERRKQQIPIPKAVTTQNYDYWNNGEAHVGPVYYFVDGESEHIEIQDCLKNLAAQRKERENRKKNFFSSSEMLHGQSMIKPTEDIGWVLMIILLIFSPILKVICPNRKC